MTIISCHVTVVQLAVCEVSWWFECVHWDPWVETLPGGMNSGSQGALLVVADSLAQYTKAEASFQPWGPPTLPGMFSENK